MPPAADSGAGSAGVDPAPDDVGAVVTLRQLSHELLGDPLLLRRLRAEALTVANLDPTYIVRTRAHIEDAFGLSLILDYVEGAWLRRLLPAATAGNADAALVVVRDVLLGLETAHREGILHRDLRPEKILVDRTGVARVAELGVVARTSANRWMPGTAEYMAPELWFGEEPSIATDVYAAAVVLLECLTGAPPYRGGVVVVREQHLAGVVSLEEVPPEVTSLVLRGMAGSPGDRYPRAWDFATDVEAAGLALGGAHWERRGRRRMAMAVEAALAPPPRVAEEAEPRWGLMGRARLPGRTRGRRSTD